MENNPTRSWWERLREGIPGLFAPKADEAPFEVSPETRVLAARITEKLIAHKTQSQFTPEQQAEWQRLSQPLSTMFTKYNMTQVYRKLNAQDHEARLQFQSMLLGALVTDPELHEQFNTALPVPIPHWLIPDDEEAEEAVLPPAESGLSGETGLSGQPVEPIPQAEPELPAEAIPAETAEGGQRFESTPPAEAELTGEAVQPQAPETEQPTQPIPLTETGPSTAPTQPVEPAPATQTEEPLGLEYLLRELRNDPEFYRIVFALRYNNPGLFNLASNLAEEPRLTSQLAEFFVKTKLGTQLTNRESTENT